jgi:NAD(P)-dependent dehydrogenase (short-subunit alcohol dehydrogenase family)
LAGVLGPTSGVSNIEDIPYDEFNFILDVNLKGVFNCMRSELRVMKSLIKDAEGKEEGAQKAGSIVNAASIAGMYGLAKTCAYVASKHAVIGLTKTAAMECGGGGVRVNAVAP